MLVSPWRVGAPTSGKSWIRHCLRHHLHSVSESAICALISDNIQCRYTLNPFAIKPGANAQCKCNSRVESHLRKRMKAKLFSDFDHSNIKVVLTLLQWFLIQLSSHLPRHYSQSYVVHRHLDNAWFNKAHSLLGTTYLAVIASNVLNEKNLNNWTK